MQKNFIGIDIGKTNLRVAVTGTGPEFKYFVKRDASA